MSTYTYTYTIFDADPNSSSGTQWPSHEDIEIEAASDHEAIQEVESLMSVEAAGLNPSDGYEAGNSIHAIVWAEDGTIVGQPSYELTPEDLGTEDQAEQDDEIQQETVQYWWDEQDPQNAGWYARVLDERGQTMDDSMKIWFPVELDEYTEEQADDLAEALREAFPEAKIEAR